MKSRLLGIIGSLGNESLSRAGVTHVLKQAAALGAETRVWDLREEPLPIFNPENRENKVFLAGRDHLNWASAVVLGSPDYHGGMSGTMKNCLDHYWKEFAGKLFGYICASHEKGLLPMEQMRVTIRQCYGWSLPYGVTVTDGDFDFTTGLPANPKIEKRLQMLAYDLTTYGALLHSQFESDRQGTHPDVGFASHYHKKN